MFFLNGADHAEFAGDLLEAFFFGFLGEGLIHIGPFVVFAISGGFEVGDGVFDFAAFEVFKPEFGVFFFVIGGLEEDGCNLLVALLLGLRGLVN